MPSYHLSTRIKAIQRELGVVADGDFGPISAKAFLRLADQASSSNDRRTLIKDIQSFLGCKDDGVLGPITVSRMESFLNTTLPKLPKGSSLRLSKRGLDMLISFEVSSPAQYERRFQHPVWPGGESGITVGIGYDLGYASKIKISNDWSEKITDAHLDLLITCSGKKGRTAKLFLPQVKEALVPYAAAVVVFYQITLPQYAALTKKTFPGVERLPPDAQAALVSLIYNRGGSTTGSSRREMKNIVALVADQDLQGIAREIRSMKRLWQDKGLPGLLSRRDLEADMVANASYYILPEDVILV